MKKICEVFKTFYFRKLSGGALSYAVLISLLIAMLISFVLIFNYYTSIFIKRSVNISQSVSNVYSGFNLALNEIPELGSMDVILFEDSSSMVNINTELWGAFYLVTVSSKDLDAISKSAIVGNKRSANNKTCLYLTDQDEILYLTGETKIEGDVSVSEKGVRSKMLEGRNFSGKTLVNGNIQRSKSDLPEVNLELLEDSDYKFSEIFYAGQLTAGDTLYNPFTASPIELVVRSGLKDIMIIGKVVITCENKIVIDKSCKLENVIIIAPEVTIGEGFCGSVQIFASDTVFIEKGAKLNYPSFIALFPKAFSGGRVIMEEDSEIIGGILLYQEYIDKNSPSLISLDKNSKLTGVVYSNDRVELKGIVKGRVFTDGIVLETASSAYKNVLMDAEISIKNYNQFFIEPAIFKDAKLGVLRWLN
ncbi:MAG: hypothetical protein PHE56_00620 [Bacteroidales bacterium]|nr:hypothetical protein [Bacteroidales bacterium]